MLGLLASGCGGAKHAPSPAPKPETITTPTHADHSGTNVYSADGAGDLSPTVAHDLAFVYVPDGLRNTVTVISQNTLKVVGTFPTGALPQHVTPSYDLRTLYVDNDLGNSLTPLNPRTGRPAGKPIPVEDPYNLYFTPDGGYAIVVAERLQRLDFRDPGTMRLVASLSVPMCRGVDHMDFSADGRYAFASCEFSGRMIEIDLRTRRVIHTVVLGDGLLEHSPQDVKLAPDGRLLYVADQLTGGLWEIDPSTFRVTGFLRTGAGAHGLYPSRNARVLYVSNRSRHDLDRELRVPPCDPHMAGLPSAREPGHGRCLRRRTDAVAERALQRRGVRNRHP